MKRRRGGWDQGELSKPASEYDIRYGHGLLKAESEGWPRYIVVTTPTAYRTARPYLAAEPAGVGYVDLLDFGQLQELADGLPDEAEAVIGLGGGRALDASKYVALRKDLPLIMVPTAVSTGAIIHGVLARWEGRNILGGKDRWPWVDCEHVLVDFDLVLEAPYYLNTAGLGDVLCGYAGLAEWRRNARAGVGPPVDEQAIAESVGHHQSIVNDLPRTLDAHGALTPDSVRYILTAIQQRDEKSLRHPAAPGGDHVFMQALELANGKGWVHGEGVALGAVIIAWQCEESPETLISRLDVCKVRRRPSDMGLAREELRKGLELAPKYMADKENGRDVNSIMRHEPVVGDRFDALWDFLESA